ncbi:MULTISPECIES: class A sortase [Enterococcus]|uniref:class A sortase n=1 Tax=Enterococcus TaxID=1350 RepID=UPI001F17C191|nr:MULTISPECIES: class A sortase [Enterococcus]
MKKLFVHWKLIVVSLTIFLIAGLSSYFYFGHQQQELDKATQSVQSTAIQAMDKKEKQQKKTNSSQTTGSDSTDARQSNEIKISDPKKQPDYVGKDVKPLTVEAMKKVNAEKVVSTFGAGMIQIPSINMNLPILEGMSQENLSVGAGTMKANQELGKGNFTLAGHYMTNAGLLFGGIKNVKKNDLVQVTYKNKTMNFKVTKVKQITAEDNQVIFDSEGNGILTLITCDSSVAGTDGRLMVRCEPV